MSCHTEDRDRDDAVDWEGSSGLCKLLSRCGLGTLGVRDHIRENAGVEKKEQREEDLGNVGEDGEAGDEGDVCRFPRVADWLPRIRVQRLGRVGIETGFPSGQVS